MRRTLEYGVLFLALLSTRLLPIPTIISPYLALAALAGTLYPGRAVVLVVMLSVFTGDLLMGFHNTMWLTYPLFGIFAYLGTLTRTPATYFYTTLLGIFTFFLTTNAAVALTSSMYPHNAAGVNASLWMGLPFLRAQLLGLVAITSLYLLATYLRHMRRTVPSNG
jgi:hypothetical protein